MALVRRRTDANADSTTFVVRRCFHCAFATPASSGVAAVAPPVPGTLGDQGPAGAPFDAEMRNSDVWKHVFGLTRLERVLRVVAAPSSHATDWYEPLLHSGRMDVVGQGRGRSRTVSMAGEGVLRASRLHSRGRAH